MKARISLAVILWVLFVALLAYGINIKNVTFKTTLGKVIFNHNKHLSEEGIKGSCKTCHNTIFNLRKPARFTMADMGKGLSCGACHNGKRAFDIKDCSKCHKTVEVVIKVRETGPVTFSHKKHLGAYKCESCHPKPYTVGTRKKTTMEQMGKGQSCGLCHNGKRAFAVSECVRCHPTKEVNFAVKDVGDVLFSHELHTGMYKCGDCHVKLYLPSSQNKRRTMAEMEAKQSCGACHDGQTAFTVKENCEKCHKMK